MKDNRETLRQAAETMKGLSKMAKELSDLSKITIPDILNNTVKDAPEEHRESLNQFVKESNELLLNSNKLDFNDVQGLIKKHQDKYGKGTNNK